MKELYVCSLHVPFSGIIFETVDLVLHLLAHQNSLKNLCQVCNLQKHNILRDCKLKILLLHLDYERIPPSIAQKHLSRLQNDPLFKKEALSQICEGLQMVVDRILVICQLAVFYEQRK